MERKKKEKNENKEKNKRKERFPIKDRKEVKREKKQFSINEKRGQKFFKPDCHSKSFFDWQYPTPREHRGKDRNTQFPLQKKKNKHTTLEKILLIRDRACDV